MAIWHQVIKIRPAMLLWRALVVIMFASMIFSWRGKEKEKVVHDRLESILKEGKIKVITLNNPHCYYIYRDEPMGFEYEMAKAFADYMGLELEVVTVSRDDIFSALAAEKGDFAASGLVSTPELQEVADFSEGYIDIKQVVIVHKRNNSVKTKEDLDGLIIYVPAESPYIHSLTRLRKQGINLHMVLCDVSVEELIRMVAAKKIPATVAYSNIANLNRRYYPDINIACSIGKAEKLRWAVKKGETRLLDRINSFMRKVKKNGVLQAIYNRYYANIDSYDYVDLVRFHRAIKTKLPLYKDIIKKAAVRYKFDWMLIAAMIYQESHFDPLATSYTGVQGIMQLTMTTAEEMGIKDRLDPEQSIMGGVRYLRRLYDTFEGIEDPDRLYISLAAYNVGRGHILDAQRIAMETGLDPNSWEDLKQVLPLLRLRKYYKKTKYGYCRGTEPVRYVENIRIYYDILRRKAIEHIFKRKVFV